MCVTEIKNFKFTRFYFNFQSTIRRLVRRRVVLLEMNSVRSPSLYSRDLPPPLFVMNLNITKKRKTLKLSSPEMI